MSQVRETRRRYGGKVSGFRRSVLALVLAGALLVCHGLFGASHVLPHGDPARAADPVANERPHAQGHAAADVAPDARHVAGALAGVWVGVEVGGHAHIGAPAGTAEYSAILLALAGVALLAAYFAAARAPLPARAWPIGVSVGGPGPWPLPRGPSRPLLQVFRL